MEKNFYEISAGGTMLREGSYLDIQRSLVYQGERADFTPFLNVPLKELEKQLKASKAEEQKIYDQLKEAAGAWDEHGAQTLLLEKAIEYLKVPEVKHTSNEWKQQEDGSWEISNLVYKMTFINALCLLHTRAGHRSDAEANGCGAPAALPGSQRKAGRLSLCRLYGGAGQRGPGAHPSYHQTALSGNGSEIPYFRVLR